MDIHLLHMPQKLIHLYKQNQDPSKKLVWQENQSGGALLDILKQCPKRNWFPMAARKPAKNLLAHFLTQNIWKRAMMIIRPFLRGPVRNILKTLWSILRAVFWQEVVMHLIAQIVILEENLKRKPAMPAMNLLAHVMK